MARFTDRAGREWNVDINIGSVMRMKKEGVNLLELEENKGKLLTELYTDDILLVQWVWKVIQFDARKLGVSEEDFYAALGGLSLAEARRAFFEEYANFSRSPGTRSSLQKWLLMEKRAQEEMDRVMATVMKRANEEVEHLVSTISDENILKQFESELEKKESERKQKSQPSPQPIASEASSASLAS